MQKEYRIRKNQEISQIISLKKSCGNNFFVIYQKENHDNIHYRYVISVPKKYGNAVERNKIRRRLKAIMNNEKIINTLDLVIIVKPKASELEFLGIKNNIREMLKKMKVVEEKK